MILTQQSYLKHAVALLLIIVASECMFIALKALVGKRPIVFSARWLFGSVCSVFVAALLQAVALACSDQQSVIISCLDIVVILVLIVFFWFQMKGYIALAISGVDFRKVVVGAVNALGYTIEETMSRLKINETGEEIEVVIQDWIGIAQLRPGDKGSRKILKEVATAVNGCFQTYRGKMHYRTSYLCLMMGCMLAVVGIVAWYGA